MTWQSIEFDSGHTLVDNGAGDYDLKCPTGAQLGFLHVGLVFAVCSGRMVCGCGQEIGASLSGQPEPYTLAPRNHP